MWSTTSHNRTELSRRIFYVVNPFLAQSFFNNLIKDSSSHRILFTMHSGELVKVFLLKATNCFHINNATLQPKRTSKKVIKNAALQRNRHDVDCKAIH